MRKLNGIIPSKNNRFQYHLTNILQSDQTSRRGPPSTDGHSPRSQPSVTVSAPDGVAFCHAPFGACRHRTRHCLMDRRPTRDQEGWPWRHSQRKKNAFQRRSPISLKFIRFMQFNLQNRISSLICPCVGSFKAKFNWLSDRGRLFYLKWQSDCEGSSYSIHRSKFFTQTHF